MTNKKIFINAGNDMKSYPDFILQAISVYKDGWTVHYFEPLPFLKKWFSRIPYITCHPEAIGIKDGEIELDYNSYKDKIEKPFKVKCIDFNKWIKDNYSEEDYIFLRMDIRCMEYKILNKMIADRTIGYIKELSVKFYPSRADMTKEEHDTFINFLKSFVVSLDILKVSYNQ